MYYVITALILLACALLIFMVVIQNSKGGGLNSSLSSAQAATQFLGAARGGDFAERMTWILLGAVVLLTFVANFALSNMQGAEAGPSATKLQQAIENRAYQSNQMPTLPEGGATAPAGQPAPAEEE